MVRGFEFRNDPYGLTFNFTEHAMLPPDKEKQAPSAWDCLQGLSRGWSGL